MERLVITAIFTAAAALCMMCIPLAAVHASDGIYSATVLQGEENGVLTLENGEKWFRVNNFENGKNYLISVKNSDGTQSLLTVGSENANKYVWSFTRRDMVASMTPEYITLTAGGNYLVFCDNNLYPDYVRSISGDLLWEHSGSALCCTENGVKTYLRYDENSATPFSCTDDPSEAAAVDIYTNGDVLERCIVQQPHAENFVTEGSGYSAPTFSVKLSDVTTDSVKWFADGVEQSCNDLSFTADCFTDLPSGIHHVSCLIEAHDSSGVHYREKTPEASFIIAKGVVPDSVLTFSDIHEEYYLIDNAVECVMERTGGYVPSLIVCTGDLVNGPQAGADIMMKKYYPQIVSHLGGLDSVFVSGNHDSGEAASAMSAAAGLGAGNNPPSGGMVFNGRSSSVSDNGKSSIYAQGIRVYGLNFEGAIQKDKSYYACSYSSVINDVEDFLKASAEDYHGELLIISAHSGLHVLGMQPDSVSPNNYQLNKWVGENAYNIDDSCELAKMINSYAQKYNMDIIYLFGHDHSRLEKELFLSDGSTLVSPISYMEGTYGLIPLSFTYAHSGYLSTVIGCADAKFSFIYRAGDKYMVDLISTFDNSSRHSEVISKYKEAVSVTTNAVSSAQTTTVTTAAKANNKNDSPKTGRKIQILPVAAVSAALLLISRKKKTT